MLVFGTFIILWSTTLSYISRVHKLLIQLSISDDSISRYAVSVTQTKITTESLESYRIINWSFPLLVLLGIQLVVLMYWLNSIQNKTVSLYDADGNDASLNKPEG